MYNIKIYCISTDLNEYYFKFIFEKKILIKTIQL